MKKTVFACIAASIILAGIGGCYYIPTGYSGSARASIDAKDVPVYMTSVALVVTGPDMMPIQLVFPSDAPQIDLDVPAGPARTFTLFLTTPSATLIAEETVDLTAGEVREILFTPKLGGTEILIPDAQNSRIVQISDMAGRGWIAKSFADFGVPVIDFKPWDIDFDDQGRIYVANYVVSTSALGRVFRIDDILHATPAGYKNIDGGLVANTLAVDRTHGYVYYTDQWSPLLRKNINSPTVTGDAPVTFPVLGESGIAQFATTGIAVDRNGYLYITNNMENTVVKYDPTRAPGSRVVASTTITGTPWDVMVHDGTVVVTDSTNNKVWYFDENLVPLAPPSYGGPVADPFVGPERFLGALGMPGIYLADEDNSNDRVVFMRDISGAGWVTYGTQGSGPGEFEFFSVP